jgi:hypothetical protein
MNKQALDLSKPATVAAVNRLLRERGRVERLRAGAGYYYFSEGEGLDWPSVYIFRCSHMTLAQWEREIDSRIGQAAPPATTCIEHGPGGPLRLSFQIKVF